LESAFDFRFVLYAVTHVAVLKGQALSWAGYSGKLSESAGYHNDQPYYEMLGFVTAFVRRFRRSRSALSHKTTWTGRLQHP
jgi:hypothetical protein